MTQRISGVGQGLPFPGNLYPQYLTNTPYDAPTNYLSLAPGDCAYITAESNDYLVQVGGYSLLQFLDPVTGVWRSVDAQRGQPFHIPSNGNLNWRVANLTGCPVGAIVAGGGSGFVQSTATITANVGGSTWQAIVGGSLSVSTISAVGANYTLPPLVMIPAPPNPGIQATAHTTIASGTVVSVVLDNFGAGYTTAPTAVILPSPFDPATSVTQATVVFSVVNSGKITGALCTYNGASLATLTALTLTAAGGAGTGATITPQVLQAVSAVSIVAGGGGWGNAAEPPKITSAGGGGNTSVSAIVNPNIEYTNFRPRDANISTTANSGGTITAATILDAGLFLSAATAVIVPGGALPSTLASIAFTMGGVNDVVLLQPL